MGLSVIDQYLEHDLSVIDFYHWYSLTNFAIFKNVAIDLIILNLIVKFATIPNKNYFILEKTKKGVENATKVSYRLNKDMIMWVSKWE